MESLYLLVIGVTTCHSHMSLNFPKPRDNNGTHVTWQLNEPMIPVYPNVCHGVPPDDTVREGNTFALGETIDIVFNVDSRHSGGHCAFWYSTDDKTFTKIVDIKDCTLAEVGAQVQLPYTMPTECGTKCTFAFSWVPLRSGACEIYMTCADIQVIGASGESSTNHVTKNFQTEIIDQGPDNGYGCQRVSEQTHWTSIFMPLVLDNTNSAFTMDDDNDGSNPTFQILTYISIVAGICCVVAVYGLCLQRHRAKRKGTQIETQRMTATVEESHEIIDTDICIELNVQTGADCEPEIADEVTDDIIDVTETTPSV